MRTASALPHEIPIGTTAAGTRVTISLDPARHAHMLVTAMPSRA